jgi:hypothetical protein
VAAALTAVAFTARALTASVAAVPTVVAGAVDLTSVEVPVAAVHTVVGVALPAAVATTSQQVQLPR